MGLCVILWVDLAVGLKVILAFGESVNLSGLSGLGYNRIKFLSSVTKFEACEFHMVNQIQNVNVSFVDLEADTAKSDILTFYFPFFSEGVRDWISLSPNILTSSKT